MTGNIAIFWPMIVQAALTFAVYLVLVSRRQGAAGKGPSAPGAAGAGPAKADLAKANLANQFELPVLFHVVCLALYVTNGASWYAVLIAWAFAVSRLVHAVVHLGRNDLKQRGLAFGVGLAAAALLWLILALHVANFPGAFGARV